jgi:hypothetical protein
VAGALLLLSPCAKPITVKLDIPCRQTKTYEDETRHRSTTMKLDKNDEETRHPTHRRYRWWSGLLKGLQQEGRGWQGTGSYAPGLHTWCQRSRCLNTAAEAGRGRLHIHVELRIREGL